MKTIKVGSVVSLLKDGTKMTVRSIKGNNVTCDWFDRKNRPHRKTFKSKELSLDN
jgi:uncharacterized protein YodC (DUF2158 family)